MSWLHAQEQDMHTGSTCHRESWKIVYSLWSARVPHPCSSIRTGAGSTGLVKIHRYYDSKITSWNWKGRYKWAEEMSVKRERKKASLNDQTEGCSQDGDSFPLLILREWGKVKPLRRARKSQLQGALSQKSDTRFESSWEKQMTALLESSATAAQAAGNRQGERRSDVFASLPWSSHLFMLFPLPFGSLQSPVILFQVWKREIQRRRSSTAGEQRYLLCHAVLVQLPEGVPMLKYSPMSLRSCLLLPEW